jgi:hypothetical protein
MRFTSHFPRVFMYRGTLKDTAALIGFVMMREDINCIVFKGKYSFELLNYFKTINHWLMHHDLPCISYHNTEENKNTHNTIKCPLRQWGWGEKECINVVRFAGLPLPPEI